MSQSNLLRKPCPGLNGNFCGQPRTGTNGYCDECRRQYQRDRYANTRQRAAMQYVPREHTRVNAPKCDCCGKPSLTTTLIQLDANIESSQEPKPAICDVCAMMIVHLHRKVGWQTVQNIVDLSERFPGLLQAVENPSSSTTNQALQVLNTELMYATEHAKNKLLHNTIPRDVIVAPRPVVEVWEDPNHFMYGRVRLERAESGNLEALEELRTWWDSISIETLETLTSSERLEIKAMLRTTELQVKTKTDEQITTDPEIKEELISEDEKALEILRNYEFIPAGPPDMSKPIPSPFDD